MVEHLFVLPAAWWPYMVFSRPVPAEEVLDLLPKDFEGTEVWAASGVIPMGWLSACGLMQYLRRWLATLPPPRGAGLPRARELRRDMPAPSGWQSGVFEIYLDNFDRASLAEWNWPR